MDMHGVRYIVCNIIHSLDEHLEHGNLETDVIGGQITARNQVGHNQQEELPLLNKTTAPEMIN